MLCVDLRQLNSFIVTESSKRKQDFSHQSSYHYRLSCSGSGLCCELFTIVSLGENIVPWKGFSKKHFAVSWIQGSQNALS